MSAQRQATSERPGHARKESIGSVTIKSKASTGTTKRRTGVKSAVSQLFRGSIPAIPTLKTGSKGVPMSVGDHDHIQPKAAMKRAGSTGSMTSQLSSCSRIVAHSTRSVFSIDSVRRLHTPDIFVTQPTNRGRRSWIVHRGKSVRQAPSTEKQNPRRVRYYHPSVTALIPASPLDEHYEYSKETLFTPSHGSDNVSIVSVPKTADIDKEFPGTVNVKKIARAANLAFEHAKDTIDGVPHRPVPPISHHAHGQPARLSRPFSPDFGQHEIEELRMNDAYKSVIKELSRPTTADSPDSQEVHKHRHNALLSLCGGSDSEPAAGGEKHRRRFSFRSAHRKSDQSGSFILDPNGATFFDDRRKSYISISESYASQDTEKRKSKPTEDKLQYLAYSPRIDGKHSKEDLPNPSRVDSATAQHIRDLYDRIEKLEEGLEAVNGSLVGSLRQATRVQSMVMDVDHAVLTRPVTKARMINTTPPAIPQRHSMIDNGFPVLDRNVESFSAVPAHTKRTVLNEELKELQKEQRRKTATSTPKKGKAARLAKPGQGRDESPLLGRLLGKLAFTSST